MRCFLFFAFGKDEFFWLLTPEVCLKGGEGAAAGLVAAFWANVCFLEIWDWLMISFFPDVDAVSLDGREDQGLMVVVMVAGLIIASFWVVNFLGLSGVSWELVTVGALLAFLGNFGQPW